MSIIEAIAVPAGAPDAVRVRVFHNNHAPAAFLHGYETGQTVTEVFTYTTTPQGCSKIVWIGG